MSTANHGLHAAAEKLSQLQRQIASIQNDSGEVSEQLSALRGLLGRFPEHPGGQIEWSYAAICGMADPERDHCARRAASALASAAMPLEIRLRGNGMGSADFLIGTEACNGPTLQHLLKSTLRVTQLSPCTVEPEAYALGKTAACTGISLSGMDGSSDWMDDLLRLIRSGHCNASISLYPVLAEDPWVARQTKELAQLHDCLTAYSGTQIRITENTGKKWGPQNPADNWEITAAAAGENVLARQGADLAGVTLGRLQQILQSGGWMAQLRIQADDPSLMEALQAVFSGSLMAHGLDCSWETQDAPRIGLLLPKQDLPALLTFPGLRTEPSVVNASGSSGTGAEIGRLAGQESEASGRFSIPSEALRRHIAMFGVAGSGKTNTIRRILTAMPEVPFLLLEPRSCDYRGLDNTDLHTMKPGSARLLRINPFWFPQGGDLQYHIHVLTDLLSAAVRWDTMAASILEQCISNTYTDMGWNPVTSRNYYAGLLEDEKLYPTFTQLCAAVESYFDKVAYDVTMQTCKHAILLRLRSFTTGAYGAVFNRSVVTPVADWIRMGRDVVVELEGLHADHARHLAAGVLLAQYYQYIRANETQLNHLLVLDDAQWLIGSSSGSEALMRDILTDLPDHGVGCLTAAHSPRQLPPDVLRRIGGRIVFRSVDREDAEQLHGELLLDPDDRTLYTLGVGSALVRFGTMETCAPVHFDLQPERTPKLPAYQAAAEQPEGVAEHLLDTSSELRNLLYSLMEPLYYQVLFDNDRENLSRALSESLYSVIRDALMHHTLVDMLAGMDPDAVVTELIETVFGAFIRTRSQLGYCLQNMVEMYTSRVLHLTAGGEALRAADWRALMDYRSFMLESRFLEMFRRSQTTIMTKIRSSFGVSAHMELIAALMENAYNTDWRDSTDEELYEELRPTLEKTFLGLPDENRVKRELFLPACSCLRSR